MNSIDLGGHSGCSIFLMEPEDGVNFVRKISKDKNYNLRLEKQCEKQTKFHSSRIKTPKVLDNGTTDTGLYYFDMEYIQGITLAEYIRSMEIGKIRGLVEALVADINTTDNMPQSDAANTVFGKKLEELKLKLAGKDPVVDEAIAHLMTHDWSAFTPSFCHGDMTLENIIVKNDELYFIDFLDSFYDSYLMDFGTLLQDIQTMWSYRNDQKTDMNLILRLMVFRDLLMDAVSEKNGNLVNEVYYALLQKLVRILPYTKDEQTWNFLLQKIAVVNKEVT